MKAPDKIYYTPYGDISEDSQITDKDICYIRKDALLEWANEQIKIAKVNNLAYSPFEKLINKLESM